MTSTPLVFIVPMPPHVTNVRHGASRPWRAAHAAKCEYWDQLDLLDVAARRLRVLDPVPAYCIPPLPAAPFQRVALRSVMHLGGAMDDDNALARHKPLLDWLTTRGYVADDRKKNVKWEGLPEQRIKRDGRYRIVLTMTPTTSMTSHSAATSRPEANDG